MAEHTAASLTTGSRVVVLGTIKSRSWTPAGGERARQTLTRLEVTAEVVAASLQWATATLIRTPRSQHSLNSDEGDAEQVPFVLIPGAAVRVTPAAQQHPRAGRRRGR